RGVASLHERNRTPTVARAPVAYRTHPARALVQGDDPALRREKCWRWQPGGVDVTGDRKGSPRTVARSPLGPYSAVRSIAFPATCAPAVARYLRCHRATRVLEADWSADSLALLPRFFVQQHFERPQGSDGPHDGDADESGCARRFL